MKPSASVVDGFIWFRKLDSNSMMVEAFIAYGGNQGDPVATIGRGLSLLGEVQGIYVVKQSPLISTTPMGEKAGDRFVNGACLIETELPALELLDELQRIESECGRERTIHWGPRTLDLDIVSFGDEVIDVPRLKLPHPGCWVRRFVLDPMFTIAPEWCHPVEGTTIRERLAAIKQRPLKIAIPETAMTLPKDDRVEWVAASCATVVLSLETGTIESALSALLDEPELIVET